MPVKYSDEIATLNTAIIKYINQHILDDIVSCLCDGAGGGELFDFIYHVDDSLPPLYSSADTYVSFVVSDLLFNRNYSNVCEIQRNGFYSREQINNLSVNATLYMLERIKDFQQEQYGTEYEMVFEKKWIFDMYGMYVAQEILIDNHLVCCSADVYKQTIKLNKFIRKMEQVEKREMKDRILYVLFTKYINALNRQQTIIKMLDATKLTTDVCDIISKLSIRSPNSDAND